MSIRKAYLISRRKFLLKQVEEKYKDTANHPDTWLKDKCGIEVIDITRNMDFNLGNVVKYVLRSGHKEDMAPLEKQIEDLKKAEWHLKDKIAQLELELAKQKQYTGFHPTTEVVGFRARMS